MDKLSKICTKCGEEKSIDDFYRQRGSPVAACKHCSKLAVRANQLKNHDAYKARLKKWYESNKEYATAQSKKRIESDRGKHNDYAKSWASRNKGVIADAQRKRRKLNPSYSATHVATRRARKLKATPKWADMDEIREWYKTAALMRQQGCDVQVDHIVPLRSPIVCGLHVEHNLQILTSKMNQTKNNRFWPNMPDESLRRF